MIFTLSLRQESNNGDINGLKISNHQDNLYIFEVNRWLNGCPLEKVIFAAANTRYLAND